jgi:prefoldin subunit 5
MSSNATPEDELRQQWAANDAALAEELVVLDDEIADAEAGMGTAGSEYEDELEGATEDVNQGIVDYQKFLDDLQAAIDTVDNAQTAIDAVSPVTIDEVPSSPSPDVNSEELNIVLTDFVAKINDTVTEIKTALTALNDAAQSLKTVAQQTRDQYPPAEDSEAEKQAQLGALDDLGADL